MKGQNVIHSSSSDEYSTPSWVFDPLNRLYRFTLDPCASKENAKCEKFYTREDDGLSKSWAGYRVFMNPPYSEVGKWVAKALQEVWEPYTFIVGVVASRTDAGWYQEIWRHFVEQGTDLRCDILPIKGRVQFGGGKSSAPFPTTLFSLGVGRWEPLRRANIIRVKAEKKSSRDRSSHQNQEEWALELPVEKSHS